MHLNCMLFSFLLWFIYSVCAEIEGYGNKCAELMCTRLDIVSSKDTEKLKKAKDEVYLKGFYEGVMLVGSCAGMKVIVDSISHLKRGVYYLLLFCDDGIGL